MARPLPMRRCFAKRRILWKLSGLCSAIFKWSLQLLCAISTPGRVLPPCWMIYMCCRFDPLFDLCRIKHGLLGSLFGFHLMDVRSFDVDFRNNIYPLDPFRKPEQIFVQSFRQRHLLGGVSAPPLPTSPPHPHPHPQLGTCNGLPLNRPQAIPWTNTDILPIGPSVTAFCEIWINHCT